MTPAAPRLRDAADVARLLASLPALLACLRHVESLGLPDAWIGAGFIRNTVWDVLHGRGVDPSRLADVDVIFFDPSDAGKQREADLEARLRHLAPHIPWSVRNQARMHLRNRDAPYRDTFDAVARWPETATAIAARAVQDGIEVMVPYGIYDLLHLIVRPTPSFRTKMDVYRDRIAVKDWPSRWPELTVLATWEDAGWNEIRSACAGPGL